MTGEFDLIELIRQRAAGDATVSVGIGDDAAVILPTPGRALVATTDSLVLGRHFTDDWPVENIGHLAMHANLSDLAAMGARPRWALLALTLPTADEQWLNAFLDGLLAAADAAGVILVGGNLSAGPLNVTVELLGEISANRVVTRQGSRPGDRLLVTGTLGDPGAALALGEGASQALVDRLQRPQARLQAGRALAGTARAMIDISDGLLADLGHLLSGGQGADVHLSELPTSPALIEAVPDKTARWRLQVTGGNDYELLFTLPPDWLAGVRDLAERSGVELTEIGEVTGTGRIRCLDEQESEVVDLAGGWDHFRS